MERSALTSTCVVLLLDRQRSPVCRGAHQCALVGTGLLRLSRDCFLGGDLYKERSWWDRASWGDPRQGQNPCPRRRSFRCRRGPAGRHPPRRLSAHGRTQRGSTQFSGDRQNCNGGWPKTAACATPRGAEVQLENRVPAGLLSLVWQHGVGAGRKSKNFPRCGPISHRNRLIGGSQGTPEQTEPPGA